MADNRFLRHTHEPTSWWNAGMVAAALLCFGPSSIALAGTCPELGGELRTEDELWLISTRHLCDTGPADGQLPDLRVWQYQSDSGWLRSSVEDFYATGDAASITMVYVHGNRVEVNEAIARSLMIYRHSIEDAPRSAPVRQVIWSWPSDRIFGPVRDARAKARRTLSEGYYLGSFLAHAKPDARVTLIGYSLGPRIITGALHLLGGGRTAGAHLTVGPAPVERRVRVVAIAPALENDWLLPGHCHGRAMDVVDEMILVYNPCDVVLRHYHVIDKYDHPIALGRSGLVGRNILGEAANKVKQIDVSASVGKSHDWNDYLAVGAVIRELRRSVLWQ